MEISKTFSYIKYTTARYTSSRFIFLWDPLDSANLCSLNRAVSAVSSSCSASGDNLLNTCLTIQWAKYRKDEMSYQVTFNYRLEN